MRDKNLFTGVVLMDLSRAFECIHPFQNILSGVPQGSILGSILSNVFLLVLPFKKSDFHSFADDYTITPTFDTLTDFWKLWSRNQL